MHYENISSGMKYKSLYFDKALREQQNYAFTNDINLTIEIDIDIDIQDLANAVNDCLNYPNKEISWSNLDDLVNQQGLSKHLTQDQSISIIDTFYNYLKIQSSQSESALRVIRTCLKKFSVYVPPEIIDFFFKYSISHIKCSFKMQIIKESFEIIYIILPSTTEGQRQFFINYIYTAYPQICLMDNFPHSAFLICICTLFKFCSFNEVFPYFHKISNIIFLFLRCELWGVAIDTIRVIKTALKKDPGICHLILDPQINLIPILTELVSREKDALSKNAIDLCTLIIKSGKIITIQDKSSVETTNSTSSLLNISDISEFCTKTLGCIPTEFEDLEISVLQFVAESLKNGLNPTIIQTNIFELFQKPDLMKFQHKKAFLSFSSAILQIAPEIFVQPFIEKDKGILVELAFESTDNNDDEMILDALNIVLIILECRQSYFDGAIFTEFVNYFLSTVKPDIDLINIRLIENEEVQKLAALIEEKFHFNET